MRRLRNNGIVFIISGIVVIAVGVAMIISGINMENDFNVQVGYYLEHGTFDDSGIVIRNVGIAVAALGALLTVAGIYMILITRRKYIEPKRDSYDEIDDVVEQMAGTRTIFDIFKSEDGTRLFSFYRDKTCYLKEDGVSHRGHMEPLEWAGKRPTVWQIMLDDGRSYVVSKVEMNILAENSDGEEIFYRT